MNKAIHFGTVAAFAFLVGTAPGLSQDIFHNLYADTAVTAVGNVADFAVTKVSDLASSIAPDRFADLLKIDEDTATVAPTVSREVLNVQSVRKIAYGRETSVQIVTTPSGVYSSDGVASPNVLYPGIEKSVTARTGVGVLFALIGGSWMPLQLGRAGSFTEYGPGYITNGKMTCLSGKGYFGCI